MKISHTTLVRNSLWVIGAFGLGQVLRLVSGMIMARLLAPEIFGIMLIVYSIRNGIELLSDIGLQQGVVASSNAERPEFYNTAWTLRLLRGTFLFVVCTVLAVPLSDFYEMPILAWLIPVAGLSFPIAGLGSLGPMFLQKRQQSAKLSVYELILDATTSAGQIIFAWFNPTVWALVFGILVNSTARAVGNFVVLPEMRHRFFFSADHAKQIFKFGIWIFLSALIYFLASNFDRLYLGKVIPLTILGVYGIARSLTEIANALVNRLNFIIIFPFVASQAGIPRAALRRQIKSSRAIFLMAAAAGLAVIAVSSDLLVATLYDARYHDAGWMLSALTIGIWFSIVCAVNESTLLGFGKPHYAAVANMLKFAWLLVAIPSCVMTYGIVGVVISVMLSDVWRYIPILVGQRKQHFSFVVQDAAISTGFFVLVALGEWLRWFLGFATSFSAIWPT